MPDSSALVHRVLAGYAAGAEIQGVFPTTGLHAEEERCPGRTSSSRCREFTAGFVVEGDLVLTAVTMPLRSAR
ncbi:MULTISPECIES: hypothetical protein [unclassified Streptomyces]|uniref:hypothetical protein n=1 Tax=unclassified Streptomyces TaxID=2593676 RepID=UPI00036DD23F|nr:MULTISPECIES: hypothetical protein [unclassified Streptomyces]